MGKTELYEWKRGEKKKNKNVGDIERKENRNGMKGSGGEAKDERKENE